MKMIQAMKMLEKYRTADLALMPGLEEDELSRRLKVRNRAMREMMEEGGIPYLQSYTLLSMIIRRRLQNGLSSKAGTRKEWRECSVCGRPAYTSISNDRPLCKRHLRTVNMHCKGNYLKKLKMLGKVRLNHNGNECCPGALRLLLGPGRAGKKCAASEATQAKPGLLKIEVLNKMERLIDRNTLKRLATARLNQPALYRALMDEIVARLEGELDHPRQTLEANLLFYISSKEELVWKQEQLF